MKPNNPQEILEEAIDFFEFKKKDTEEQAEEQTVENVVVSKKEPQKDIKDPDYIAFMCAVHHINFDYLEETLKEYAIGLYIIAAETTEKSHKETNGEHFHFLVQMTDNDYHKYSKRVFKDKFKLRGVAKDGKPRQYGRVKKIEDLTRMAAYTIKQDNVRTNMTEAQLAKYKAVTFLASEQQSFEDQLYEYLINNAIYDDKSSKVGQPLISYDYIGPYVIKFIRNHNCRVKITRNKIDGYIRTYQMYYLKDVLTAEQLFDQFRF